MVFSHYSVLFSECMDALDIREGGTYVDCTAGGGGHSAGIAARMGKTGTLIAFDRDADAVSAARERLSPLGRDTRVVQDNFVNAASRVREMGIDGIDGALIDLGVSSYQLDNAERGFSYMHDAPLDMRMDKSQSLDAALIVNTYDEKELRRIIYAYGEERFAPQIARAIVAARADGGIRTTGELAEIIKSAVPEKLRERGHHPAKKTFQSIRIEVNGELGVIEPTLRSLIDILKPGGHLAVITFHSLEDRIVKQTFAQAARGCTCPPDFPVCVCGKKPLIKIMTRKPVEPGEKELEENPRSRSAKLRVCERL